MSDTAFGSLTKGVAIKKSLSEKLYDPTKTGPANIDDFGLLDEHP